MPNTKRSKPPESPPTIDLGIAGWRVPLHSHIACLCETEERFAGELGFAAAGLRGSDHCLVVGDPADNQRLRRLLAERGLDVASLEAGGRLRFLAGVPSAEAMLSAVTAAVMAALAAGARVLRLTGTSFWHREGQAPDAEIFALETRLTELVERWPCVILCMHEARALSGVLAHHGVLETHPTLLAPSGVVPSPFFVALDRSPEQFAAIATELSQLQREREALRQRSEVLQTIFDHIPVMVSLYDPVRRRQLLANREWERVLGWTVEEAQRIDMLAEAYPDPEEHRRALEFIRQGQRSWQEFRPRTRSGRIVDTLWSRYTLSDGTSIGFGQDITERKRTEERLRQSSEGLRALSERLRSAREQESARIAREVHDEVGQMLTALRLDVAWLERQLESPAPPAREALGGKLRTMSQLLDTATDAVHRIIGELRPGILDELGLEAAVEWYVGEFEKRTAISCRLRSSMAGATLPPDYATALFRILQEALTNVARHAGATTVDIRLAVAPEGVTLEVADNGRGIPEDKVSDSRSIGLLGMRERARALGGEVVVRPLAAGGTMVEVNLPR
jgi:PAS domain S-box-containing protein